MKKETQQAKKQTLKKVILVCGILASAISVGMGAMSGNELKRASGNCFFQLPFK